MAKNPECLNHNRCIVVYHKQCQHLQTQDTHTQEIHTRHMCEQEYNLQCEPVYSFILKQAAHLGLVRTYIPTLLLTLVAVYQTHAYVKRCPRTATSDLSLHLPGFYSIGLRHISIDHSTTTQHYRACTIRISLMNNSVVLEWSFDPSFASAADADVLRIKPTNAHDTQSRHNSGGVSSRGEETWRVRLFGTTFVNNNNTTDGDHNPEEPMIHIHHYMDDILTMLIDTVDIITTETQDICNTFVADGVHGNNEKKSTQDMFPVLYGVYVYFEQVLASLFQYMHDTNIIDIKPHLITHPQNAFIYNVHAYIPTTTL